MLVAAATLALGGAARGQTLQRLTVQSFVLSSDTVTPQVDAPFHLIVTLRVRERARGIANLQLPMLAQLELLGDERQTVSDSRGTQYREVVTVVAHAYGPITIAPATLQAIDARDGKSKQWYTNDLALTVGSPRARILNGLAGALLVGLAQIFTVLLWVAVLGAVVIFTVVLVRRRRAAVPISAPVPAAPEAVAGLTEAQLRRRRIDDALVVLRAEHTRSAAVRVRSAVWRTIGAPDGETLGDVLRRPGSNEPALREVLVALERSAFTYDEDLQAAIDDACAALERYAGWLA